jgi:GMP synthase-like glutamine amidotransferase
VATALVVENDPDDDARRLGQWLEEAGLRLDTVRPHAGDPLPEDLDGYAALVVLGGGQHVYEVPRGGAAGGGTPTGGETSVGGGATAGGQPAGSGGAAAGGEASGGVVPTAWLPACEALLRRAVRHRVPTLAICLGAQLLATAHGGEVAPAAAGPEIGPNLVARRDAAGADPLFAPVPFTPDVIQWHQDEITQLPAGAVLLAASPRCHHQAFRIGPSAWGLQFHIEPDLPMVRRWAATSGELLERLGLDADRVVAATERVLDDVAEVWQPFAARFAALAQGKLAPVGRDLPLLGR